MSVRPVRIYGDPVLSQRAHDVETFDDTLRELVADMRDTMRAYHGVGLAANQVGVLQRVLVAEVPLEDGGATELLLVNPEILERSGADTDEEGCLSIPGIYEAVRRSTHLRVRALDAEGRPFEVEAADYLARVLQHEIDHLDGVLFVDRLSLLKRQFLRGALDGLARGEVPAGHPKGERGVV